ncbi:hypothetical protein C8R46DRAFT_1208963 [Mycena filopes]|nr:hypothetical protein C8R46DRAFT_1208963 [Mycena filopes]
MSTKTSRGSNKSRANRKYYQAHPELREKNKLRIAERRYAMSVTVAFRTDNKENIRDAAKRHRRKWDPPKKSPVPREDDVRCECVDSVVDSAINDATPEALTAAESAAQLALDAMYRLRIANESRGLADLAGYNSSEDESVSQEEQMDDGREQMVDASSPTPSSRQLARLRAYDLMQLRATQAEQMRIIVESSRSWQEVAAIHKERGSVEVDKWRRAVESQ